MATAREEFMTRAIELAKKGSGSTSPNPAVGAVVVKNKKIVGEGYHKKIGAAHAEVMALREAGAKAKGATIYVTLEPCCHHGRTPPCTEAIIEAGITKVVAGTRDPFPKVNGRGGQLLGRHGIDVEYLPKSSALAQSVRALNQPFFKWAGTGLPYVTIKAGISLDGRIATRTGHSQWITSEGARKDARLERSMCDAVLVGAGTVRADNPELAAHGRLSKKSLLRVIMDPELSLPTSKQVFRDEHVLVACTNLAKKKDKERFDRASIAHKSFGPKRISIKRLLQYLGKKEIQHVYVEGGSGTHGFFFDDARLDPLLVDRALFYIEPKIIGGSDAMSVVGGRGVAKVTDALSLNSVQMGTVDGTIKVEGVTNQY